MTRKSTPTDRRAMMDFIISVEARRDKLGRLRIYRLPAADGGGSFEVAGINDRYHPTAATHLRDLLTANRQAHAENFIRDYLLDYTSVVTKWTTHPAIESFLRDTAFNRGPRGALRILQLALKVADDGRYGPKTKSTLAAALKHPGALLQALRTARESYEIRIAPPVGARARFWQGLVNRWDKALSFAETLL